MESMCHFAAKIPASHDHSNMLKIHAGPRNPPVRQSLYIFFFLSIFLFSFIFLTSLVKLYICPLFNFTSLSKKWCLLQFDSTRQSLVVVVVVLDLFFRFSFRVDLSWISLI